MSEAYYLRDHVFKRVHNTRTFRFLVIGEAACDDNDCGEHHSEIQLQRNSKWTIRANIK